MPFVNKAEYEKVQRFDQVLDERNDFEDRYQTALAASASLRAVVERISQERENGSLLDAAKARVQFELEHEERDKAQIAIANGLRESKRRDIERRVRVVEGPKIREELDTLFQTDGTYAIIDDEVTVEVRSEVADQLREEYRASIEAKLSTPEGKAELIAEVRAQMTADELDQKVRTEVSAALQEAWREEALDELKAEITTDEEAKEEQFKKQYKMQLEKTTNIQNLRTKARNKLEEQWKNDANQDLAASVGSDELANLVSERIKLEKQLVEKKHEALKQKQLEEYFTGEGFAASNLEAGTRLEVFVGGGATNAQTKDDRGYWQNCVVNIWERKVVLIATNENGRYRVQSDTLANSKSPYEKAVALTDGVIITIGRKQIKNGKEYFEQKLSRGAQFSYDDNMDDEHFVDGLLPVTNLSVDGVMAIGPHNYQKGSDEYRIKT